MTTDPQHRTVTHEDGERLVVAIVERTPENEQLTDEEIVAGLDEWRRNHNHLHPVDDE
ncbi:hypothetical protein ACIQTN_25885 [Streptomyces werraensis]|uniref:hypothetical protein n=1 Tax=Streptomyces werraensis TaxID=68284 RepID=UPI00382A5946